MAGEDVHIGSFASCIGRFGGRDTDDIDTFVSRFEDAVAFKTLDDRCQCRLFPLLLTGSAYSFYQQLDDSIKFDLNVLKETFKSKYGKAEQRWLFESKLLDTRQTKSVNDFIESLHKIASQLGKGDEELLSIFVRGLKPHIRSFVISKEPENLDDAEGFAKLADSMFELECADSKHHVRSVNSELSSELSDLKTSVKQLQNQLSKLCLEQSNKQGQQNKQLSKPVYNKPIICYNFQQQGHIARNCPFRQKQQFRQQFKQQQQSQYNRFQNQQPYSQVRQQHLQSHPQQQLQPQLQQQQQVPPQGQFLLQHPVNTSAQQNIYTNSSPVQHSNHLN